MAVGKGPFNFPPINGLVILWMEGFLESINLMKDSVVSSARAASLGAILVNGKLSI